MERDGILNSPPADVAELLPASLAFELRIVPLADWHAFIVVGCDSPLSDDVRDRLLFVLNRKVRGLRRSPEWIDAHLHALYDSPREVNATDLGSVCWYWPDWHGFNDDGTLVIHCSGWHNVEHWSGIAEFPTDHEDHEFWRWVVSIPQYRRLLDEAEVPCIKRIWRHYLAARPQILPERFLI